MTNPAPHRVSEVSHAAARSWRSWTAVSLLAAYGILTRSGRPGHREQALFARVNDAGEQRWLRVPQQWGTPWTLPAVAAAAVAQRRIRYAAIVAACLPLIKGVEVVTKKRRARPRPLYVQPTALRDDAPIEGGSMPSGHAALAAAGAVVLAPLVPRPVRVAVAVLAGLSGFSRVHQGAHQPVDVVAGWLLGGGVGLAAVELGRLIG